MFAYLEFVGDLAVLHSLRHETNNLIFPLGQQAHSVGVDYPNGCKLGKCLHHLCKLAASCPDLPDVDLLDALAKGFEGGLRETKEASCTRPECVYDKVVLVIVVGNNGFHVRPMLANLPQCAEAA